MEHCCSGRINFDILASTLYDLLDSKFLSISICIDVRSIVLQTAFLVKLDVSPRKKLRYNCLIVNVFLYCSLSKSDLSSIDFAFNRFFMKLFKTNNIETVKVSQSFLVYLFQSLCCVVGQTSSNRNLVFVRT